MNVTCRTRPPAVPRAWMSPRILLLVAVLAGLAALGVSAEDRQVRREAARKRVAADMEELAEITRGARESALAAELSGQFLDLAVRMLPPEAGEDARKAVAEERAKVRDRFERDLDVGRTRYLTVLARMTRSIARIEELRGKTGGEWAAWDVCLEVGVNFRERAACRPEDAADLVAEVSGSLR
ncbi:MAG: hypothetical protein HUU15_13405 [Candidatus Brocadiae bacterium]|nr:hypothetical protein [Candidatus Brocadiia bacterium]